MKVTKRILMTLLTLVTFTGAWAIDKDSDGYYLIGSVQDWKDFVAIIEGAEPATYFSARMTADINLGSDQTMIGAGTTLDQNSFQGTFDGQGHTLTIAYSGEYMYAAPFRHAGHCTIKNLNVKGTISNRVSSGAAFAGGIVGYSDSNCTIEKCQVNVNYSVTYSSGSYVFSSVAAEAEKMITIKDCFVEGLVTGRSSGTTTYYSPFIGLTNSASTLLIQSCLSIASTSYVQVFTGAFRTARSTNVTMKNVFSTFVGANGMQQCTAWGSAHLADGYIAYLLQDGRSEMVWGQQIGTDSRPVLTTDGNKRVYRDKNCGFSNTSGNEVTGVQRDVQGYYLIAHYVDWKDFAAAVAKSTGKTYYKARLTRDVDLGYYQDKVGATVAYYGIFDGQGHTLTVHYIPSDTDSSPFPQTADRTTIQNLCLAGTMENTTQSRTALVSLHASGTLTIDKVWVAATITSTQTGWDETAAFVGCCDGTININDCLFTGSITSSGEEAGCFVGGVHGTVNITNSLSTGTFRLTGVNPGLRGTYTNTYVKTFPTQIQTEMQCPTSYLTNGYATYLLQNSRSEEIWVQDTEKRQPMLKVFIPQPGISTGIDNGQRTKGFGQREGWFTIDGRKLDGKPAKKGIYINNGQKTVVQ